MSIISIKKAPNFLIFAGALKNTIFAVPIIILYFQHKGVSTGDFFLIQGIFAFLAFFVEIPTGYIGDLFSRKLTLIIGFFLHLLGSLLWIYGYGFYWLLGGELLFAISLALYSGTFEAYLYDLLKKQNNQKKFHKKMGNLAVVSDTLLLVATLSGGVLYQVISPEAPIWGQLISSAIAIIILLMLPDVPESRRQVAQNKSKIQDIIDISKATIKHPSIKWLIIFPAIYGGLTLVLMWGLQTVMIARDIPVFMFSFVMGANAIMRILYGTISPKLLDKLHISGVIKLLLGLIVLGLLGAVLSQYVPYYSVYLCLVLMMIGAGSIVLIRISSSTLINHRIASDERATVISVKSMAGRIFTGLAMLAFKPMLDDLGVSYAFLISGIFLLPIFYSGFKLIKLRLSTDNKGDLL